MPKNKWNRIFKIYMVIHTPRMYSPPKFHDIGIKIRELWQFYLFGAVLSPLPILPSPNRAFVN